MDITESVQQCTVAGLSAIGQQSSNENMQNRRTEKRETKTDDPAMHNDRKSQRRDS